MRFLRFNPYNEKGTLFIVTFILIFILISFSFALYFPVVSRRNSSQFNLEKIQSQNIAEAALANAINDLKSGGTGILGSELSPLIFNGGNYYSSILNNSPAPGTHTIFAIGQYNRVRCNVTTTIRISGNVVTEEGTEATFSPTQALVCPNPIHLIGNVSITGSGGGIHSNQSVVLNSPSTTIEQTIFATEQVETKNDSIYTIVEGAASIDTPKILPEEYKGEADYILSKNGLVYDKDGNLIHDANSGPFKKWKYMGLDYNGEAIWNLTGNASVDGMYFIDGNVKVSGNPGSPGSPWKVLLIATGSIQMLGNPKLAPLHPDKVVLMAGTDLVLSGNSSSNYQGFYAAHEQIKITGTPQIEGSVYAEGGEDVEGLVSRNSYDLSGTTIYPDLVITGTPNIEYNADISTFLANHVGPPEVEILGTGILFEYKH